MSVAGFLDRRRFQEATAMTFDAYEREIRALQERVRAQGEFLADLAVRLDHLEGRLRLLETLPTDPCQ